MYIHTSSCQGNTHMRYSDLMACWLVVRMYYRIEIFILKMPDAHQHNDDILLPSLLINTHTTNIIPICYTYCVCILRTHYIHIILIWELGYTAVSQARCGFMLIRKNCKKSKTKEKRRAVAQRTNSKALLGSFKMTFFQINQLDIISSQHHQCTLCFFGVDGLILLQSRKFSIIVKNVSKYWKT